MEFKHALREFRVSDDVAIWWKWQWTRETCLDVDLAAIDTSEESTNDCGLILRAAKVMVKNAWHNSGMNVTRQILDVDTKVKIW